jgi:hypothetical protein
MPPQMISIINDDYDDSVFFGGDRSGLLTADTPFCREQYNNWFTEIHCEDRPTVTNAMSRGDISKLLMDALKQSKKIRKLKSLGFSHCFVVLHKTTNGLSDTIIEHLNLAIPPTRKYNTVLFSLQLLRNGFYSIETDTNGINREHHPNDGGRRLLRQHSFCHTDNDLQEAVWNEVCGLPAMFSRNFEIECGIIDAKRQQDQFSVLESRLHTEIVSHNDCVSNQLHDLREYHEDTTARLTAQASVSEQLQNQLHDLREYQEDTTARLTAQASVSEQLQNQLDTVRAGMECLHSAVHTLQGEQDTVLETVHGEIESRCEWTAHVMTELTQRKTEVVALREQLERYRTDARWLGYVCGCVVSMLVVPVAYLIASR